MMITMYMLLVTVRQHPYALLADRKFFYEHKEFCDLFYRLNWKIVKKTKLHYQCNTLRGKKVSEYDQEIPQSQTADNPVAP